MSYKKSLDKIIVKYRNKYMFIPTTDKQSCAVSNNGVIILNVDEWKSPDAFFVFTVLHEIGHCETYQKGQYKVKREYLATQWAIDNSKEWNVKLKSSEQKRWQEYIYSFSKAKDKSKYKLNWCNM